MKRNSNYSYSLVKRLSFTRYGGTDDELRAANILLDEIKSLGGSGELADFTIPAYNIHSCGVSVSAPYTKTIEAAAYAFSGSLPEGGVDAKLVYLDRGLEADYIGAGDLSSSVVLINSLTYDAYKLICEKKPLAFMVISGKYYNTAKTTDLVVQRLKPQFARLGLVPGFMIRAKDAQELLSRGAKTLRLDLRQTDSENTSRNVISVIPGTSSEGGSVVLTAHYDSVLVGTGSWDNATGAAALMYIYRHFLKNPPRHTMRFIWCGAEEQGLLGSRAFVEQNPDIISDIRFNFNFDMCGTWIGENRVVIAGGDDLKHMSEQICKEEGFSADVQVRVHSSDSAPFADNGIPCVSISRGSTAGDIHTRYDLIPTISPKQLTYLGSFAIKFISRVANAVTIPIPLGMPEDMKKKLDQYFMRDKEKE